MFTQVPSISSLSTNEGPVSGGTRVTLHGENVNIGGEKMVIMKLSNGVELNCSLVTRSVKIANIFGHLAHLRCIYWISMSTSVLVKTRITEIYDFFLVTLWPHVVLLLQWIAWCTVCAQA